MDHGRMQPWPPNQLESKHTCCHIFVFVSLLLTNKSNSHSIISKPSLSLSQKKTHSKLIIFFSLYMYIYNPKFIQTSHPPAPPNSIPTRQPTSKLWNNCKASNHLATVAQALMTALLVTQLGLRFRKSKSCCGDWKNLPWNCIFFVGKNNSFC